MQLVCMLRYTFCSWCICLCNLYCFISKAQDGMSELLGTACVNQQIRHWQQIFSVKISAKEVAYLILQLPMRKPYREIERMPDECEEIHCGGLLQRYIEALNSLENITSTDWAAWYDNFNAKSYHKKSKQTDINGLPLETYDTDKLTKARII